MSLAYLIATERKKNEVNPPKIEGGRVELAMLCTNNTDVYMPKHEITSQLHAKVSTFLVRMPSRPHALQKTIGIHVYICFEHSIIAIQILGHTYSDGHAIYVGIRVRLKVSSDIDASAVLDQTVERS